MLQDSAGSDLFVRGMETEIHKNFAVDEVLIELFKAFNLNFIIGKLSEHESEGESLRLI